MQSVEGLVRHLLRASVVTATIVAGACASTGAPQTPRSKPTLSPQDRLLILRRSQLWEKTDVASKDLKRGPQGKGAFAPGETVSCTYVERKLDGHTPKFDCAVAADDEVKVKYGLENGEVYGEVAGTRLLWALGFGADRMYPVRVVCRGCPHGLPGGRVDSAGAVVFDPAVIERKAAGHEITARDHEGWSWKELDLVDEAAGGAPIEHRDALKLLAVLMQHTDNKAEQQRLVCLDTFDPDRGAEACSRPFMLINDLGKTFGRSDIFNRDKAASVNFERWSSVSVWKGRDGCVGNLAKSMTGTLYDPLISEPGRQFLSGLLAQLTDAQLADLFDAARVTLRPDPNAENIPSAATVQDWVNAFKKKRAEIAGRNCPAR